MAKYSVFSRPYGMYYWNRQSAIALPKAQAVQYFQNILLNGALHDPDKEWQLRRVKDR